MTLSQILHLDHDHSPLYRMHNDVELFQARCVQYLQYTTSGRSFSASLLGLGVSVKVKHAINDRFCKTTIYVA